MEYRVVIEGRANMPKYALSHEAIGRAKAEAFANPTKRISVLRIRDGQATVIEEIEPTGGLRNPDLAPFSLASGYDDGRWEVSDKHGHLSASFYGPEAEANARRFCEAKNR